MFAKISHHYISATVEYGSRKRFQITGNWLCMYDTHRDVWASIGKDCIYHCNADSVHCTFTVAIRCHSDSSLYISILYGM